MRIVALEHQSAICEADGIRRQVNTYLLQAHELNIGDYLLVHIGYAIEKIDPELAKDSLRLINEAKDA